MNILHISTSDSGGAGKAAYRIHKSLLAQGVNSKMLVMNKTIDDDSVYEKKSKSLYVRKFSTNKLVKKIQKFLIARFEFLQTELEKFDKFIRQIPKESITFFTAPISAVDLLESPLIYEADIIHLHWIEGFVDYPTFFKLDKSIVWTYHDENIAYGGFHYTNERQNYYQYYRLLEDQYLHLKKEALKSAKKISMVSLSTYMDRFCKTHSLFASRPSVIIPNSVDSSKFICLEKSYSKLVLKIPSTSYVVSFCAYDIAEPRKGLSLLLESLEQLNVPNLVILIVGGGEIPIKTNLNIYRAGYVENEDIMSLMYSASDLFVLPSFQEAFAQTPLEAMSCGVPVVAFPVSGIDMLINDINGIICNDFTVESLAQGIRTAIGMKYDSMQIRKDIINRFSPQVIANKYIAFYHETLNNNDQL